MRPRDRRLARIAAARVAPVVVPCVLFVGMNETQAEARARFDAEYKPKPGTNLLVVPAKPGTEAEHEVWAERFFANQSRLVAEARRERVAVVNAAPTPQAPPKRWPTSPTIRPNTPHIPWRPQC